MRIPRRAIRSAIWLLMLYGGFMTLFTAGALLTGDSLTPRQLFEARLGLAIGISVFTYNAWFLIRR